MTSGCPVERVRRQRWWRRLFVVLLLVVPMTGLPVGPAAARPIGPVEPICVPWEGPPSPPPSRAWASDGGVMCFDPDQSAPSCAEGYALHTPFGRTTIAWSSGQIHWSSTESWVMVEIAEGSLGMYSHDAYVGLNQASWQRNVYHEAGYQYHGSFYQPWRDAETIRLRVWVHHGNRAYYEANVFCEMY